MWPLGEDGTARRRLLFPVIELAFPVAALPESRSVRKTCLSVSRGEVPMTSVSRPIWVTYGSVLAGWRVIGATRPPCCASAVMVILKDHMRACG